MNGRAPTGRRVLLAAVAVALTATALLAVGILLFGTFGETEGRILATSALLAGYGLLALPAGFLIDQGRLYPLAALLLALAAAGFGGAVVAVWGEDTETLAKTVVTLTAFGVAAAQTSALAARRRGWELPSIRILFALSVPLVLVVAALVTGAVWAEVGETGYFRAVGALAVLDLLVVVLQPVLAAGRGGGATSYRLLVAVEGGAQLPATVEARDFATAAAKAIRQVERSGYSVRGVAVDVNNGGTAENPQPGSVAPR